MNEPRKVLLIDDEKGFTEMLRLNLEATGQYNVCIENDSKCALETALRYQPDIILLDIIMPEKHGPQVAIEIKGHNALEQIPIIFFTATVTKNEVDSHNGQIGGHAFVAKPSSLNELINSIEKKFFS